jgi:predicted amidohydrolase
MPLVAAIQLSCTSNIDQNLTTAEALIRRAAGYGATFIATPEATDYLGPHSRKVEIAEPLDGPRGQFFSGLAQELGITLLIGSVAEQCDEKRTYNTSLLYGPDGKRLAAYRKMHLFDVDLAAAGGVTFRESDRTAAGESVVVSETPIGRIGLSICYDVRFAELYRALADRGAEILSVPSAFTMMTGKDHWHVLLRARAIENQAWLVAPGQCGQHDDKGLKHSYGHSVIVDPWGRVAGECGDEVGLCLAELDLAQQASIRRRIPMCDHRRL